MVKVKSVKKLNTNKQVYDLWNVIPNHNFVVVPSSPEGSLSDHSVVVHNCGVLDEVEFYPGANVNMELSKVMRVYRAVKRRMESRFMRMGKLPGILFLVSSKKSEHSFLEQYISKVRGSSYTYVIEKALWEAKPEEYSGEKFSVAVGTKYLTTKVLGEDDNPEDYERTGYRIIKVPVEHKHTFMLDPDAGLTDVAGVSVSSSMKFMYYDKLAYCIDENIPDPCSTEVITLRLDDTSDLADFIDFSKFPKGARETPLFAHVDTSLTGDLTGVALIMPVGVTKVNRLEYGDEYETIDLSYRVVLAFKIRAEAGSEIPFYKIRELFYYMRDELGFNILSISADGYQSRDMIQQFKLREFESEVVSVDKDTVPYDTLKLAINEGRFKMFNQSILIDEFLDLEEDKLAGKIDHPEDGSKDLSDAVAGAVYSASKHKELRDMVGYQIDVSESVDIVHSIETKESPEGDMRDFEREIVADMVGGDEVELIVLDDKEKIRKKKRDKDYVDFISDDYEDEEGDDEGDWWEVL